MFRGGNASAGIPLLEMFNLLASFTAEEVDNLEVELLKAAFGEELLRLDGIKAEGKNCSSKNVRMEEWRRKNGKAGKRKRPINEIKPVRKIKVLDSQGAICIFLGIFNFINFFLPYTCLKSSSILYGSVFTDYCIH
jgi:hypothetical protein